MTQSNDQTDWPEPQISDYPLATYALLLILVIIFTFETNVCGGAADGSPSVSTLLSMGGLSADLVRDGQWFRIATELFLHASPAHLFFNCLALFLAGKLELIIGRIWFLFAFMISGLGGSCVSLLASGPNTVSVGASGAILGLLVIQIVVAYSKYEEGDPVRRSLLARSWGIVIPTLMQFSGSGVDIGAHIGGTLSGLLIGAGLVYAWERRLSTAGLVTAWTGTIATGALACSGILFLWRTGCG